jgi:hypothetical protein
MRSDQGFAKVLQTASSKSFLHLANGSGERLIAEDFGDPARKILAVRVALVRFDGNCSCSLQSSA